jgi:hypothetical protein
MEKLLSLAMVSLFLGVSAVTLSGGQDRGGNEGIRDQFVGAWRLVSLEQRGPDGEVHGIPCCGMFVFTRDGHMSVQVMRREPSAHQTPAGSDQYSRGGYEATYGKYEIDQSTHTFTIHVEGSLVAALIGKDLPRTYEFSGKQLIVKSAHPEEHWKVTWEHY